MKKHALFSAALAVTVSMTLHAHSDSRETVNDKFLSIQEKFEILGLSAIGVRDGETVSEAHLGLADAKREIPVTEETLFRIASVSKVAASIALMQLWEEEKFQLDDDISDALGYPVVHPRFPDSPITYRHLLTHTSGLRDGANYNTFLMATYRAAADAAPLRDLIHAEGASYNDGANFGEHKPGDHYAYSNLNYGIIGTLVEKMSGKRFDVYCREKIFEPLGMKASFNLADISDISLLGVLYRPGDDGWEPQFDRHEGVHPGDRIGEGYQPGQNGLVFSPQGGLRSSARDLTKLMALFMNPDESPKVLKQSTIELMLEEHWSNGKTGRDYRGRGLGLQRTRNIVPGELWIGHSGRAYGLLAGMFFQAEGDQGIVLLSNGSKPGRQSREFYEMERELFRTIHAELESR